MRLQLPGHHGQGLSGPYLRHQLPARVPVNIYKATAENSPFGNPVPCDHNGNEIIHDASDPRLKEWLPNYDVRDEA